MSKSVAVLLLLVLCTGCASIKMHSTSSSYPESKSYPYCGVVYDGCIIIGGLTGESITDSGYDGIFDQVFNSILMVIFGIVDMPLSFCLDTIFLLPDLDNLSRR